MIELLNVSKKYKLKDSMITVLDDTTFHFKEGVNIGILGRNGAGKSTTMRMISGSEHPTSGLIKRKGKISWPLGFAGGFSVSLTGEENLRFICRIYNEDIKRVQAFVEDFSELDKFMYEPIKTYSSGMRARLAFALSMAIDFDLYLIDEITGVGDMQFQEKCHHAFEEKSRNSTLIIISHSMETIKQYCTELVVLEKGKFIGFDDVDEGIEYYTSLQMQ